MVGIDIGPVGRIPDRPALPGFNPSVALVHSLMVGMGTMGEVFCLLVGEHIGHRVVPGRWVGLEGQHVVRILVPHSRGDVLLTSPPGVPDLALPGSRLTSAAATELAGW